jgi:hypothetical protein
MEILDMTFAGIPVGMLIAVVAGWYFVRSAWRKWRQDFAGIKEIEEAHKRFRAKDGRPRDDLIDTLGYDVGLN